MRNTLSEWLNLPAEHQAVLAGNLLLGLVALLLVFWFARKACLPLLQYIGDRIVLKRFELPKEVLEKLNFRVSHLLVGIAALQLHELFFSPVPLFANSIFSLSQAYTLFFAGMTVSAIFGFAAALYNRLPMAKDVPIQGLVQVMKLATFLVTVILLLSQLLNKSPLYLLSGLGALTAVLLLIFKDTILGFVASIQIAANRLVTYGDWIEMSKYGADGEVTDIGLNTVKVKNWDNTVTTIPTYALISDSFKNWRAMQDSGGRRIKRSIYLDMNSIKPASVELQQQLRKLAELKNFFEHPPEFRYSNLTLFRHFAEAVLRKHKGVNQNLTLMVRELQPTEHGLPVEVYCFSADKRWIPYEHLQADIIDHLLSHLALFELCPYQAFSGQLRRSH